jgi:hypothetical protein
MNKLNDPKIILHIGEGKTGSTSIQQYLFENKEYLLSKDIIYLTPENSINHNILHQIGLDIDLLKLKKEQLKSIEEEKPRCQKLFFDIQSLINDDTKAIIISSECIFGISAQTILIFLKQFFPKNDLEVIAYIRDPLSRYTSYVNQRLYKTHQYLTPFTYKKDVYAPIDLWIKSIGRDKVHALPFSSKTLEFSDAVVDFINRLNLILNFTDNHNKIDSISNIGKYRRNISLTVEQLIVIQNFRLIFLKNGNGKITPRLRTLINFFKELNHIQRIGNKFKLKKSVSQILLKNSYKYFSQISKEYPQFSCFKEIFEEVENENIIPQNKNNANEQVSILEVSENYNNKILCLYAYLCLPLTTKTEENIFINTQKLIKYTEYNLIAESFILEYIKEQINILKNTNSFKEQIILF